MRKIAINRPFFSAIIELIREVAMQTNANMQTNLRKMKNFSSYRAHNQIVTPMTPNINCNSTPFSIKIKRRTKKQCLEV